MAEEVITAESLLRDIYEAESALRLFEQKYGLLSETFYRLYQKGQLRDEDPEEIQEYMEWSGWYEIYQDRRRRYEQAVVSPMDDEIDEISWLRAASRNPAFSFLADSEEDIYSIDEGQPFCCSI